MWIEGKQISLEGVIQLRTYILTHKHMSMYSTVKTNLTLHI